MESPMLKRRLNPFLLATTILVLSLLAGLSVMYSGVIEDKVEQTNQLNSTLDQKNQEISELQAENSNLTQELEQEESRADSLATESSNLESEINSLEEDIDQLESEKSDLEIEVEGLENTTEDLNMSISIICADDENNLTETSQDQCDDWGHEYQGN